MRARAKCVLPISATLPKRARAWCHCLLRCKDYLKGLQRSTATLNSHLDDGFDRASPPASCRGRSFDQFVAGLRHLLICLCKSSLSSKAFRAEMGALPQVALLDEPYVRACYRARGLGIGVGTRRGHPECPATYRGNPCNLIERGIATAARWICCNRLKNSATRACSPGCSAPIRYSIAVISSVLASMPKRIAPISVAGCWPGLQPA